MLKSINKKNFKKIKIKKKYILKNVFFLNFLGQNFLVFLKEFSRKIKNKKTQYVKLFKKLENFPTFAISSRVTLFGRPGLMATAGCRCSGRSRLQLGVEGLAACPRGPRGSPAPTRRKGRVWEIGVAAWPSNKLAASDRSGCRRLPPCCGRRELSGWPPATGPHGQWVQNPCWHFLPGLPRPTGSASHRRGVRVGEGGRWLAPRHCSFGRERTGKKGWRHRGRGDRLAIGLETRTRRGAAGGR